ncbi:MAG: anion permease [Anaerolineae bacterium]|nr:anion permease [Anaerolineae bacterium]
MTLEILLVLIILLIAVVLFVSEKLRMDLVALLVLIALAATGLVTPAQAISGFSSSAVVTVWAMFIISGGLSMTGVANILGQQVMRLAGEGEARLIAVIMSVAGVMSAFMNNVGVAAMMLPVVIDIARRTNRPPSRLLMPLALGSLLGGLTTLIGTPPNILVSDALRDYGLKPFAMFDFIPTGLAILLSGILFMAFIGRHLLPQRDPMRESAAGKKDLTASYHLGEKLFLLHLSPDSPLAGKSLADSRLGSALRLHVVAILRNGQTHLAPTPDERLRPGDRLMVQGQPDALEELHTRQQFTLAPSQPELQTQMDQKIGLAEARLSDNSSLVGQTIYQAKLRGRLGVNVLAIQRHGLFRYANLPDTRLLADDLLLLQGPFDRLEPLADTPDFAQVKLVARTEMDDTYRQHHRFIALHIPADSGLAGRTLIESRLGDAYGLSILGILRDGELHLMPEPGIQIQAEDTLLAQGSPEALTALRGLQDLTIETQTLPDLSTLESENVGLSEIILSPQSKIEGKTLRQLHFREKYGLSVLAIWRQGEAHRANLRDMSLRFGDAILVYGPREKLRVLRSEQDFLLLTEPIQEFLRTNKAPVAVLIMIVMLIPVLTGLLPISIAAIIGAVLMVLSRCLTMEEAYRYIEWPAVFLIAGMLPLGIAMEQTGAALYLADGVISLVGNMGPRVVIAAIFILTSIATQIIPTAALVVLMAPIAINTAANLDISPFALMMTVAIAASASFSSPVSHPANVMIMGPGGYRFIDYMKVGLPLTLLVLLLTVLLVPVFWPLVP